MYRISIIGGFVAAVLFLGSELNGANTQSKPIPLDQIWGYNLPGTRDIRQLEPARATANLPAREAIRRSPVLQIYRALGQRPKRGETAGPAFVVEGRGHEALKNAHAVFTDKEQPRRIFPPSTDLSLVFYAYIGGRYVRIESIEKSANQITVNYQFVSHSTADSTVHFALIPLGDLPEGVIRVKIKQLPSTDERGQIVPMRDGRHIVCDSFSFAIQK